MDSARLEQIEDIYHAARDIAVAERDSFLHESCGDDHDLRSEVESLLRFDNTPSDFIDTSPGSLAADMFAEKRKKEGITGKTVGHYTILQLLGAGGMGEVYLAEDTKLDRKVALKILSREFAEDTNRMSRFVREAKSASALNHPNIITIHEINEHGGTHFIATEFIDGKTLNEYRQKNPPSLRSKLKIAIQVASALDEAHSAGLVHRDIKPENVMIRKDGIVKVLDFGLAKPAISHAAISDDSDDEVRNPFQTQPGLIIGTPNYMSPEQARGKPLDHRTDIFSFGVVLYEMLSGNQPFAGETVSDIMAAVLTKEPQQMTGLPPELENIVYKALQKEQKNRYQKSKDMLDDLKKVQKRLDLPSQFPTNDGGNFGPGHSTQDPSNTHTAVFSAGETAISGISHPNSFTSKIRSRGGLVSALAIIFLAVGGFFGYRYFTANTQIRSVAVMPFANETGSANNEYLSDGLTDSLINRLSQLPKLKVIARSSSFRYKSKDIDVVEVAKTLGVQAIVTGRITQQGDDMQISVELINTADNTRIWGDIYNRKVAAAQNVPEEIAQAVSQKLQLELSGAQEQQLVKRLTNNPQAYQAHLNGVFFRRKNGAENIRKAIEYQNQAIALDPNFTLAYIELSINYGNLVDIGSMSPKEGVPLAKAAAEMALVLDDKLADAYYNVARIRKYEFEWPKAEAAFKRAIEINPNLAGAHTIYAEFLSQVGRFDEALREIKISQELDPLRTGLVGNEGSIYYYARRYDESIEKKQAHVKAAPENPFSHLWLANGYVQKGDYANALVSYNASLKIEETTSALIYLGRLYALTGKRSDANAILDKLKSTDKYVSPAELSILYAGLGDTEKAFASLEKAYTERDIQLTSLKVEPAYDPLRDDPRFQDLLRRVGLSQ